jgi:hypothetical protein
LRRFDEERKKEVWDEREIVWFVVEGFCETNGKRKNENNKK